MGPFALKIITEAPSAPGRNSDRNVCLATKNTENEHTYAVLRTGSSRHEHFKTSFFLMFLNTINLNDRLFFESIQELNPIQSNLL